MTSSSGARATSRSLLMRSPHLTYATTVMHARLSPNLHTSVAPFPFHNKDALFLSFFPPAGSAGRNSAALIVHDYMCEVS